MDEKVVRVLDANLNRAREGLRVCEEVARLVLEDPTLTGRCQRLRYDLERAARERSVSGWWRARNVQRDVGRPRWRGRSLPHAGTPALVAANMRRVEEALRVLEEFSRLLRSGRGAGFSGLRFRAYALEQALLLRLPPGRHR